MILHPLTLRHFLTSLLILAALPFPSIMAAGSGDVIIRDGVTFSSDVRLPEWRSTEDVIPGFDWSVPPGTKPSPRGSLTFRPRNRDVYPGRIARVVNVEWRELEPEEGKYNFDVLRKKIDQLVGDGADSITLRLTGSTKTAEFFDESGRKIPDNELDKSQRQERSWSDNAPPWLEQYGIPTNMGKPQLGYHGHIVNYDIFHPDYHQRYLKMLRALGQTGLVRRPEIGVIYIHGVSSTPGEEGPGANPGDPNFPLVLERLKTWAAIVGPNAKSLVFLGHHPKALEIAYGLGIGTRNGYVERYLLHTDDPMLGQSIDKDGYLTVDESNPLIANNLASGDENEEYNFRADVHVTRFGPVDTWPHRYRESSLRVLQMRRNYLWEQSGPYSIDPPLTAYVAVSLGKTIKDTPDAWTYLRESTVRKGNKARGEPTPVKNFERWLHQRDRPGYETKAVKRVDIPEPKENFIYHAYVRGQTADYVARQGAKFGFAVDDRFASGNAGPHAIKVTYYDEAPWELIYKRPTGVQRRPAPFTGDGQLKTATFFLQNPIFAGRDLDFDFEIHATDPARPATIRFVRIIRPVRSR